MRESTPEAGRALMDAQMAQKARDPAYLAQLTQGRQAATVYRQAPALLSRARNQTGYISDWESANVGMSSLIRTPLTTLASGAEAFGSAVFGDERATGAAAINRAIDPRFLFRALLGGNTGALSDSATRFSGPIIGQSSAQVSSGALVQDIINRAASLGGGGGPSNVRGEVTDPIVRATQESATRIEGAIGRISLGTPGAPTGSTTNPTPTRQQ
jgi:hypothetical protein